MNLKKELGLEGNELYYGYTLGELGIDSDD
jgi:hypothetical protein